MFKRMIEDVGRVIFKIQTITNTQRPCYRANIGKNRASNNRKFRVSEQRLKSAQQGFIFQLKHICDMYDNYIISINCPLTYPKTYTLTFLIQGFICYLIQLDILFSLFTKTYFILHFRCTNQKQPPEVFYEKRYFLIKVFFNKVAGLGLQLY